MTPTTWNLHSDAYVTNEESMLDWEGNMKHERDHEKRVVLEDIPSDDTMISSLALCEKEQMAYHPILLIKMKTSMLPMVLRMNTNYTMP